MINTRKIAYLGLLLAGSLILGLIENMLPPILPVLPYARLGLGNIAILLVLLWFGSVDAGIVLILKCVMLGIFVGTPSMILYSLFGGLLSLTSMQVLLLLGKNGIPAISAVGGIMHNIGQVIVAMLITQTSAVLIFLPYLMLFGGVAGVFVGVLTYIIVKRIIIKV